MLGKELTPGMIIDINLNAFIVRSRRWSTIIKGNEPEWSHINVKQPFVMCIAVLEGEVANVPHHVKRREMFDVMILHDDGIGWIVVGEDELYISIRYLSK